MKDHLIAVVSGLSDPTKESPTVYLTQEPRPDGKNPMAVALGHLGGIKGGKARAAKLSAEERRYTAWKAARARWDRRKD